MIYRTIFPSPELARYVRFFWILEGHGEIGNPYIHRSMADGCAEMIFHYRGQFDEISANGKKEKSCLTGLHGPSRRYRRFSIEGEFGIFGVYLYPYALPALFSIPSTELANQMPSLSISLGKVGEELAEKMLTAPSNAERLEIMAGFLKSRLNPIIIQPPGVFETINQIIQTQGTVNVKTLAEQNFLSVRQFERKFKQFSGFSPKLYSRIVRFQSTLAYYRHQNKSLTEIAMENGYYDQSHFIQDFKEFSGHNPKAYFSGKTESTKWKDE